VCERIRARVYCTAIRVRVILFRFENFARSVITNHVHMLVSKLFRTDIIMFSCSHRAVCTYALSSCTFLRYTVADCLRCMPRG
jgi:hypothetical protein